MLWDDEMFWNYSGDDGCTTCKYTKKPHWTIHFKRVDFMVCELYLSEKKNVFVNNNLSYLDRKITKQKYKKTIHTRQLKERRIRAVVYEKSDHV